MSFELKPDQSFVLKSEAEKEAEKGQKGRSNLRRKESEQD